MAGLGILEPLDPNSRSATILGDGGPSALEVAYKRKGMEADIGKNIAEAEAAKEKNKIEDDKNKIEQNKLFEQLPSTVKLEHAEEFANFYNEEADKIAEILTRSGGVIPIAGPDGAAYRRSKQALAQLASNSEQLNADALRQLAIVQANPTKYLPGTADKLTKELYDKKWLRSNTMPPNLVDGYFDVNGYLEPLFSKIKADQDATGYVTAEGGTDESTTKYILRDDIKALAVMGASDLNAFPALTMQLQNMSPEMQGKIAKIAKDNGITPEAAAALELGIGLVEFTEKTRDVTAPSDASAGRRDKESIAKELIENLTGIVTGDAQNKPFSGLPVSAEEAARYAEKFPQATRGLFDKEIVSGAKFYTNLEDRTYKNLIGEDGKKHPEKIIGTIRYPNGDVRVVYNSVVLGGSGGKETEPKITERIPEKEVWSRVGIQIAKNDEAYDLGTVESVFERDYTGVGGTRGQVPLGGENPVDNTLGGKWGSKAAANKYN